MADNLNCNQGNAHAMTSLVGLGAGSNRTGIVEESITGTIVSNLVALSQTNNSLINIVSNFFHNILHGNIASNSIKQNSIDVFLGVVSRIRRSLTCGVQTSDQIRCVKVSGIILNFHAESIIQAVTSLNQSSIAPIINIGDFAIKNLIAEFPSNGGIANKTSCVVQSVIQLVAVTQSDGIISMSRQLLLQGSRIASRGGRLLGLIGLGINLSGSAASQHGNSHDTGQHQGSNFLELHSEFFLLMVYKR